MTTTEKERLICEVICLLQTKIKADTQAPRELTAPQAVEMLTIQECLGVISGISESTLRRLINTGKIQSMRAGDSERGKILVKKADLIAYFNQ